MKKVLAFLLALTMISALCACGQQAAPASSAAPAAADAPAASAADDEVITIKLANSFAATHPCNVALEEVQKYLDEQTGGKIIVDVYPAGALGSNVEIAQQMIAGEIDAVISGACDNYASFNPLTYVEDLPFLFKDYESAYAAYDGEYGAALKAIIDELGCHTVSMWENGFRQVTNNVRPVTSPADMSGLKMRSSNATLFVKFFECLDCSVTMLDMTELFSALQQGIVDGQENPLTNIQSSSYYEVQKYCTLTNHIYLSTPVVFNLDTWNSYSPETQALLTEAFDGVGKTFQRECSRRMADDAIAFLTEKGMQIDEVADYEEWVTALAPVWDYFKEEYGAEGEALIALATK